MGWEEAIDSSRACPRTPSLKTGLSTNTVRREIILAAGVITVLSIAALSTYLFWVPPIDKEPPIVWTYAAIAIDGDADFSATALLEEWPGDGSPENPYIIDRLYIDLGGGEGHCISISNTRVSFTISNCLFTGASDYSYWGAGIFLSNVTNGEIVNNTCRRNHIGILLVDSDSNAVVSNTCNSNPENGISLRGSDSNTLANNTCNYNGVGIILGSSYDNTVANNSCINNGVGIALFVSNHNTVANNTCNSSIEHGIFLDGSDSNTVANNIFNNNGVFCVVIYESDYNTVVNNTGNSNGRGIWLPRPYNNTVENNTCNYW